MLTTMSMQVKEIIKQIILGQLRQFLSYLENLGMKSVGGTFPASIQIVSSHIAPKISVYNSINIYHWKDMKIVGLNSPLIKFVSL